MTYRDSDAAPKPGTRDRRHLGVAEAPQTNLATYIRSTEHIIDTLKRDLNAYRRRHDDLSRDKNEQNKLLTRLEVQRQNYPGLTDELQFLRSERNRLSREVTALKDERQELTDKCARLEASLEQATSKYQEALEVVSYLEAQIESVESIVALLKEHKRFMDNGDE